MDVFCFSALAAAADAVAAAWSPPAAAAAWSPLAAAAWSPLAAAVPVALPTAEQDTYTMCAMKMANLPTLAVNRYTQSHGHSTQLRNKTVLYVTPNRI